MMDFEAIALYNIRAGNTKRSSKCYEETRVAETEKMCWEDQKRRQ